MKIEVKSLSRNEFDELVDKMNIPAKCHIDYLYNIYDLSIECIKQLGIMKGIFPTHEINHQDLIYYCLGEYLYSIDNRNEDEIVEFEKSEDIQASMASVASDKYMSLSIFNHKEGKLTNEHLPPISSLNIYINFMLNILNKYQKNDPSRTLIADLLVKSLSISRSILNMLVEGYETEAFANWRTLHECEATLVVLEKYGEPLINTYLKHMRFGFAFKDSISDKTQQDEIFYSMKDEMKEHDLKSKDIKKYVEYGWLYSVPGFSDDPTFKLNFRDGLQRVAGLEEYNKIYMLSSEIIHSTPILIYANKEYYYFITLLNVYESFFRLEKIFSNLFMKFVSSEIMNQYEALRKIYFTQLINIHRIEVEKFKKTKAN